MDRKTDEGRRVVQIHAAFVAADLDALRAAVGDPAVIPNGQMPPAIGPCLTYAIYHSPLAFVRTMLELGADATADDPAGFPPLIAALSTGRQTPGAMTRSDVAELVELLLAFGADPDQRGVNDYTALHMAVAEGDTEAVALLLAAAADPHLRTRIDDRETPREMAIAMGNAGMATMLAAAEARLNGGAGLPDTTGPAATGRDAG